MLHEGQGSKEASRAEIQEMIHLLEMKLPFMCTKRKAGVWLVCRMVLGHRKAAAVRGAQELPKLPGGAGWQWVVNDSGGNSQWPAFQWEAGGLEGRCRLLPPALETDPNPHRTRLFL